MDNNMSCKRARGVSDDSIVQSSTKNRKDGGDVAVDMQQEEEVGRSSSWRLELGSITTPILVEVQWSLADLGERSAWHRESPRSRGHGEFAR